MVDWSQLSPELVVLIGKRLEARFDVLSFRSVCSSWRSSIPPKFYAYRPLPTYIPSRTQDRREYSLSNITRNTFYLIRLAGTWTNLSNQIKASFCWLIKLVDGTHRVEMRMLNPLSDSELKPLPGAFPKVLDLATFQVSELGHEYIGQYDVYINGTLEVASKYRNYRDKVVFLRPSADSDDFIMLALFGYLAFLRSGEKEWTILEDVHEVQDIISFNGKCYAIDRRGRTIVIDKSLNVSFLKHVFSPGSRKFLVESDENLLAVERLSNPNAVGDKVVGFRVLRMNEEEQKWDEMETLGDRILFLGFHQAISAPASVFGSSKGNLIFYLSFYPEGLRKSRIYGRKYEDKDMFVFDLETNTSSPLENCPAYCNLFGPPPQWVTSPESLISSITSAGKVRKEVDSKHPSASSKFSFKFNCFLSHTLK